MQFSQDYSKRGQRPKKIPIGRFLILALLFYFGWRFISSEKENPLGNASLSSSQEKSSSSQEVLSSSEKKEKIKFSSWKEDGGLLGQRLEFAAEAVTWDELLRYNRLSQEQKNLALLALQACPEKGEVKIRFYKNPVLNQWGYECGNAFQYRREKEGPWVDAQGCRMHSFCWEAPFSRAIIEGDSAQREILHFQAPRDLSVKAILGGRVQNFSSGEKGNLELRLPGNFWAKYEGNVRWNRTFSPGEKLKTGEVLGLLAKGSKLSLQVGEGSDLRSLGELVAEAFPYSHSLWKDQETSE